MEVGSIFPPECRFTHTLDVGVLQAMEKLRDWEQLIVSKEDCFPKLTQPGNPPASPNPLTLFDIVNRASHKQQNALCIHAVVPILVGARVAFPHNNMEMAAIHWCSPGCVNAKGVGVDSK